MTELYKEEWDKTSDLPKFAEYLLNEYQDKSTHINVKIFILKIISNNAKLFKSYAKHWFEPICEYVILKENGGKGFHYFLRDLCTILISWSYVPENPSDQTKILMTKVINSLILISADDVKLIFKQNIKIISSLMNIWKSHIAVNKMIVTKMLSIPDS